MEKHLGAASVLARTSSREKIHENNRKRTGDRFFPQGAAPLIQFCSCTLPLQTWDCLLSYLLFSEETAHLSGVDKHLQYASSSSLHQSFQELLRRSIIVIFDVVENHIRTCIADTRG